MKILITVMMILVGMAGTTAFAAEKSKTPGKEVQLTAEQRQNMAGVHENMAACLRSDKTMKFVAKT